MAKYTKVTEVRGELFSSLHGPFFRVSSGRRDITLRDLIPDEGVVGRVSLKVTVEVDDGTTPCEPTSRVEDHPAFWPAFWVVYERNIISLGSDLGTASAVEYAANTVLKLVSLGITKHQHVEERR